MEYTEEEIEFIKKEKQRFEEADGLFFSLMKKYKKKNKIKRFHLTKNKDSKYPGRTIFVDMVTSYSYTEEEKELLYKCFIAMPSRVLFDFERLYIKSSSHKLAMRMKEMEERIKEDKEYLSLHTKFGMLSVWKDVALKEIKELDEENILLDYGVHSLLKKINDNGKKHGKYPQIYEEIDLLIEKSKNESTRQTQKSIILFVLKKHIDAGDTPELTPEYEEFGEDLELYYEKRFKSAYYNYVRRKP